MAGRLVTRRIRFRSHGCDYHWTTAAHAALSGAVPRVRKGTKKELIGGVKRQKKRIAYSLKQVTHTHTQCVCVCVCVVARPPHYKPNGRLVNFVVPIADCWAAAPSMQSSTIESSVVVLYM